ECFSLSPDGLCQKHLDMLDKHLRVEDILHTARVLSEVGITTVYHFLVNVTGEDAQTIVLNLIRIMPNTKVELLARESGEFDDNTDLLYPVYYDPAAHRTLHYALEIYHQKQNVAMWWQWDDAEARK
ncbi:MAG: B12 lower ligand biosynthesis radical SAM protein BzaD, partial [Eubacterium aggregans]